MPYTTGNVSITGAPGAGGFASGGATWSGAILNTAGSVNITAAGGGAGGMLYNGASYSIGYTYPSPQVNITHNDITINGLSLKDFMCNVQDRLAVMRPNPELEKEFDELRACAEKYRELEKKFLDQKKVFDILKKPD